MKYRKKLQKVCSLYFRKKHPEIVDVIIHDTAVVVYTNTSQDIFWSQDARFWLLLENLGR